MLFTTCENHRRCISILTLGFILLISLLPPLIRTERIKEIQTIQSHGYIAKYVTEKLSGEISELVDVSNQTHKVFQEGIAYKSSFEKSKNRRFKRNVFDSFDQFSDSSQNKEGKRSFSSDATSVPVLKEVSNKRKNEQQFLSNKDKIIASASLKPGAANIDSRRNEGTSSRKIYLLNDKVQLLTSSRKAQFRTSQNEKGLTKKLKREVLSFSDFECSGIGNCTNSSSISNNSRDDVVNYVPEGGILSKSSNIYSFNNTGTDKSKKTTKDSLSFSRQPHSVQKKKYFSATDGNMSLKMPQFHNMSNLLLQKRRTGISVSTSGNSSSGIFINKTENALFMSPNAHSAEILAASNTSSEGLDAGSITGIALGSVVFLSLLGAMGFIIYKRRNLNKPQTLSDKSSNPDSSVYIEESSDDSEEMYSLDNDSFLNSLEAMTIQNYWTENVKHTKL